ncbi:hypothetical protein F5I97DRAFT_1467854 [Phlebopus sp. FC_14]|nr:hypothetical protein F5I97DRAFT_1467854 [Phlebopus sp. FC_14]
MSPTFGLDDAAQKEVAKLTAQISALESRKQVLVKESFEVQYSIRSLQSRVAHITNETAPVSRLPSDVLAIVFEETRCLLSQWVGVRRPLPIEVQLSHVCARWRQVALSTPSLWTTIRMPILHKEIAIKTYLQRCNECPLSIHLGPQMSDHWLMGVFSSWLIPRIAQFRELILDTEDRQELYTVLELLANTAAPRLKRLKITGHDPVRGQGSLPRVELFKQGAPLLSDIRLSAIPITFPQSSAATLHFDPLPGPGIPLSRNDLLSVITPFASSLTVLHLKGFVSGLHEEPGSAPIVLPAVEELLVHGNALVHGFNVFRNLSTPMIRTLTLVGVKRQALTSIHKFMARTGPEQFRELRTLHYLECGIDDDLDIYLPHATAALRHLSLTLGYHSPMMRLLLNSDKQASLQGTSPLWPNLRTLSVHLASPWPRDNDGETDDEDEIPPVIGLFVDVIQQRKSVGSSLELLRLEGTNVRAFQDELVLALMKSRLHVNTEVLGTLPQPRDARHSEEDWVQWGNFYGSQHRALIYRRLQTASHGHPMHWAGSMGRVSGTTLAA